MQSEEQDDFELSYDDPAPGVEIIDTSRFSKNAPKPRIYKLADSAVAILGRLPKRKSDVLETEELRAIDADDGRRANALLLRGPPISHLNTDKIFAYSGYYSTAAEQLEWVDDQTVVLVYPSSSSAMAAYDALRKSREAPEQDEDTVLCQPLPMTMWPVEERLAKSLGKSQGLTGQIRMRWALNSDVKVRGARQRSTFYKKHGDTGHPADSQSKRRRGEDDGSLQSRLEARPTDRAVRERELAALDAELEAFATKDAGSSAVIEEGVEESRRPSLADRLGTSSRRQVAPLPQRARDRRGKGARTEKPALDKDSLDAELEAFLNRREVP